MAGRATLITDASMDAILEPRMVAASTQRLACEAQPGVSGAPRMTPVSHGGCATLSMRDQQRSQPDEPRRDPEPLGAGAAEHRDRYAGSNQRARFGPPSRLRADASPSVLGGLVDRTPLTDPPERLIDHVSGSHGWRDWAFRPCSRYRTLVLRPAAKPTRVVFMSCLPGGDFSRGRGGRARACRPGTRA